MRYLFLMAVILVVVMVGAAWGGDTNETFGPLIATDWTDSGMTNHFYISTNVAALWSWSQPTNYIIDADLSDGYVITLEGNETNRVYVIKDGRIVPTERGKT